MRKWILSLLVVALILGAGLFILFSGDISGKIYQYECDISNSDMSSKENLDFIKSCIGYMNISDEQSNDILTHPNDYSYYRAEIYLRNNSLYSAYYLTATMTDKNSNLWFNESSLCEGPLDLHPFEDYSTKIGFLLKTKGISEQQISDILNAVKLNVRYSILPETVSYNFNFLHKNAIIEYVK